MTKLQSHAFCLKVLDKAKEEFKDWAAVESTYDRMVAWMQQTCANNGLTVHVTYKHNDHDVVFMFKPFRTIANTPITGIPE